MDSCSDAYNLTDCLLQSVLDASKEHNKWDVPSLCVTVVIGIVALIFAALTVIQGLFGPGHRKCSKDAIGDWNKKTKHLWNWSEFRRDAIAYTPVITFEELAEIANKRRALTTPYKPLTDRYFPATWLYLLTYVGINRFILENFERTQPTAAEYLPSEVQAVPAYMDIDTIVALAAMAGCTSLTIDPESKYPFITGANIQVRFRRDPFLGIVCSFECYSSKQSMVSARSRLATNFDLRSPNFRIKCGRSREDGFVNVLDSRDLFQGINTRVAKNCINDPTQNMNLHQEPSNEIFLCPHAGKSQLCSCETLLIALGKRHNLSWLLCAEPMSHAEVFPAKKANIEGILGTIVAQSPYWSRNHLSEKWILRKLGNQLTLKERKWESFWVWAGSDRDAISPEWTVFSFCLHFATNMANGRRAFLRLPQDRKVKFRAEITAEMAAIDNRIKDPSMFKPESNPNCIRVEMYIQSATLMRLQKSEPFQEFTKEELYKKTSGYPPDAVTAQDVLRLLGTIYNKEEKPLIQLYDLFLKAFDDCWAVEVDILIKSLSALAKTLALEEPGRMTESGDNIPMHNTPIDFMMMEDDPMRELLVYRTVLLAINCLTALDNSEILDKDIGSQIVPFL